MVFCGQCGLQLAPDNATCPRCGSITEPEFSVDDPHLYDPTITSPSFPAPQPLNTPQPPVSPTPQHKLVLRPDDNAQYYELTPNEPASAMSAQTPVSPLEQRSSAGYPPPISPYTGFPPHNTPYQSLPGQFNQREFPPPQQPRRRGRGLIVVLLSILIILLLLLGTVAAVVLKPDLLKGILGQGPTPIVSPTALSASDHVRSVMNEYYSDINTQNYQGAYNLWGNNFQSTHLFTDFEAGYAHTRHDDLTINSLTPVADGTMSVDITIKATEDATNGGTVVSTYHGIYIVGQENGNWKILSGTFQKVG